MAFILGDKEAVSHHTLHHLEELEKWRLFRGQLGDDALLASLQQAADECRIPVVALFDARGQLQHLVIATADDLHEATGVATFFDSRKPGQVFCVVVQPGDHAITDSLQAMVLHLGLMGCLFVQTQGPGGETAIRSRRRQRRDETPEPQLKALFTLTPRWRDDVQELACDIQGPFTLTGPLPPLETFAETAHDTYHHSQRSLSQHAPRAVIIGCNTDGKRGREETQETTAELRQLLDTLGYAVSDTHIQNRPKPDPRTYLGEGKVASLALTLVQRQVQLVAVDDDLSPTQLRHLENRLRVRIMDRSDIILAIFQQRAQTPEARLQVELAQLKREMPRLSGRYGMVLSQQTAMGGQTGRAASRGPGETALELGRRALKERITHLEDEVALVAQRRERQRARRKEGRSNPAFIIALVGYTNAGKSTLMQRLTGERVLVEDKLFATLDPLSRPLFLPQEHAALHDRATHTERHRLHPNLLIDTVGFIRKLPTQLIYAFRSTLEEAVSADLLVHVWDVADAHALPHWESVRETLLTLKPDPLPEILVCNKIDKTTDTLLTERLDAVRRHPLWQTHPAAACVHLSAIDPTPQACAPLLDTLYDQKQRLLVPASAPPPPLF